MTVHLSGGPKDGEILAVPDHWGRLEIVLYHPMPVMPLDTHEPIAPPIHRTAWYLPDRGRGGVIRTDAEGLPVWRFQG